MRLEIDTADYEEWLEKYEDGKYKRLAYVIKKSEYYEEYSAFTMMTAGVEYIAETTRNTAENVKEAITRMMSEYGIEAVETTEDEVKKIGLLRVADRLGMLKCG